MEKTLHDIRAAEAHAEKIQADAREKAALLLSQGKADAEAFIADRKQTILSEKAAALSLRKKELEKEQYRSQKKAEKKAEEFAVAAQQNSKKVVAFFVQECKKALL